MLKYSSISGKFVFGGRNISGDPEYTWLTFGSVVEIFFARCFINGRSSTGSSFGNFGTTCFWWTTWLLDGGCFGAFAIYSKVEAASSSNAKSPSANSASPISDVERLGRINESEPPPNDLLRAISPIFLDGSRIPSRLDPYKSVSDG